MRQTLILFLLLLMGGSTLLIGGSYVYKNQKMHPIQNSNYQKNLSQSQLADATYYNQQRIEGMQSKLKSVELENRELKRQMQELRLDYKRLKNLYFRRF